ncbi:hypothetical protein SARC_08603 [Sphaeroforma arctica JP610]|uniref:Uncharacterized protein n=1 Tax=Sphaeroforma arctica JP610 TaxID=667725 RepID=A0A0L0FSQ0_9EUKA|nr:hypothetical protein SARC_08603 [Sphaeroforma arctica JP610]KNC78988.1 hypothetical protein SARC_08603 [Sphaeroforma arctica JP610]|eukprot:XP_014152890.1 hypothetical protein SARC_08603 [Sphaeroforma arctica JP610]
MIDSIQEELINTVYKNHYSKSPSEFFTYICITNNSGSHGRFWDCMQRLFNFKASGTTEKTMQALEEIFLGLLDADEVIPDEYLICALLYSLVNEYQLLRSNVFDLDTDKLDVNEVYRMPLKFEDDHQISACNTATGINALTTKDLNEAKDKRSPREITCPLCKDIGHGIDCCCKSICRRCGSRDHIGKKCLVDSATLTCSKCDNKTGRTTEDTEPYPQELMLYIVSQLPALLLHMIYLSATISLIYSMLPHKGPRKRYPYCFTYRLRSSGSYTFHTDGVKELHTGCFIVEFPVKSQIILNPRPWPSSYYANRDSKYFIRTITTTTQLWHIFPAGTECLRSHRVLHTR